MKIFKYLSPESKVWIYQASRSFNNEEHTQLNDRLVDFCRQWTAHNSQLVADFDIVYDRFIVLVVDETATVASGCSIDKSVRFLKETGEIFGIDFFDKLQIAYMQYGELLTVPFADVKTYYQKNKIEDDTLFFDTNVLTLEAYKSSFVKPLQSHWLMKKVGV